MKKVMLVSLILILLLFLSFQQVSSTEYKESITSSSKPFYIKTHGETKNGCLFVRHMFVPWPDQTYFTLLGIIFYKDGDTTIYNSLTNETISAEGSHKVVFYKFQGPTSSVGKNNVSFEGKAVYATIIGG